ncbi:MAG: dephospho-CoA kinase [Ignavibacteriae bacterium]|jgi:dephospho-CoA kinase|nr:dephospho-CoA kinase [Ignavibacteriota bacterium]
MGNKVKGKVLIGITGGIGSGKSEVCRMLSKKGYMVIFADSLAKELYKKDKKLSSTVVKAFGKGILNYQGVISLTKLRELVFANKKNFKKINDIVHPVVIKHILGSIKNSRQRVVIIESALVFDTAFWKYLDYVIMVYSNKKNRLQRIMLRDGANRKEVENIMRFQLDEKLKIEKSDFVIVNNKSIEDLESDVEFFSKVLRVLR